MLDLLTLGCVEHHTIGVWLGPRSRGALRLGLFCRISYIGIRLLQADIQGAILYTLSQENFLKSCDCMHLPHTEVIG